MTTPRQIEANRLNAQRSTGPNTPGGRARSAFNGLRHGLYAREVVLPGEDREAYDCFLVRLKADMHPRGAVERGLLNMIADLWWRLGRSASIEAGLLNPGWSLDPRAEQRLSGGGPLVDTFRVALDDTKTLDALSRYEGRLERALARALNTFANMQNTRLKRDAEKAEKTAKKAKKSVNKTGSES